MGELMRTIETKLAPAQAVGVNEAGTFTARVAAFGNVDSYGDRLLPGAFAESLAEKAGANKAIPILWSHDWMSVPIGYAAKAFEDGEGLVVEGQLLMADTRAQSVHRLMQERAVTEFSFGFIPEAFTFAKTASGELVRELSKVDLVEVSPVLYPANDSTELLSTRSTALARKAGATLSAGSKRRLEGMRVALIAVADELAGFLEDPKSLIDERMAADGPLRLTLATDPDPHEATRRLITDFWPGVRA
jgi:HK97 family phage prohead protease